MPLQYMMSRLDYSGAILACLHARLLEILQLVVNAVARLVYGSCKNEPVTPLLHNLHWLRVQEVPHFDLRYLRTGVSTDLCHHTLLMNSMCGRHWVTEAVETASTMTLVVPSTSHLTIGDHAFAIAATRVWHSLHQLVTPSPSPTIFWRRLKTDLFIRSY